MEEYRLEVETVQLDGYSASFTLHWGEHLLLNGLINYKPHDESIEHVHFFYNTDMYTTLLLRVVLKYVNLLHEAFRQKMKSFYSEYEENNSGGKRRRLINCAA
ncbi:MAG: hypothetical protein K2Q45_02465 [Nitrosomonas sp.]|nr:hypothetical protein [Nitrosomonas sp.]